MDRFPMTANTKAEVLRYYMNRSIQALPWGWSWDGNHRDLGFGVSVMLTSPQGTLYPSLYLFESAQGKGHYKRWLLDQMPAVGFECRDVQSYLEHLNKPYVSVAPPLTWTTGLRISHNLIRSFYRDGHAKRSGLSFMNHIDEGLYILQALKADQVTMQAFCLHPIFQMNKDLLDNYKKSFAGVDPNALILAMEYRHVANAYLSRNGKKVPSTGLLPEVREMLVADKIQNKKDFQVYLHDVGNAWELKVYFDQWLNALGVSVSQYEQLANEIQMKTGRPLL